MAAPPTMDELYRLHAAAVSAAVDEATFILREALYGLLHLHAMEEMGQAHLDQPDRWRKAWARAAEAYGEKRA